MTAWGQSYTVLKSFGVLTNVTGFTPEASLIQDTNGMLYGTTSAGEGKVAGTVFKIQPDGSGFTVIKRFTNSFEGANPYGALVLAGGTLYGTTYSGGGSGFGTVFKLNTDGNGYAVLKHFTNSEAGRPRASCDRC